MLPIQLQYLIPALFALLCLMALARALRNGRRASKRQQPVKTRRRERRFRQRRTLRDRRKVVRGTSRRRHPGRRGEDQWSEVQSRF